MIQGGTEEPCLPPHYPEMNEEETGYPCPRREWPSPDGPLLYGLVTLVRPETGHLFREMFAAHYGDSPRAEQQRAMGLILKAYGDEAIGAALWPKRE